jgi:hypothetical protein
MVGVAIGRNILMTPLISLDIFQPRAAVVRGGGENPERENNRQRLLTEHI